MEIDWEGRRNVKTTYIISYDISEDKLRTKIAKLLEDYGVRIQYSVFECNLTEKKFKLLYASLVSLTLEMEKGEGSIRIYPLCGNCQKKQLLIGDKKKEEVAIGQTVIVI